MAISAEQEQTLKYLADLVAQQSGGRMGNDARQRQQDSSSSGSTRDRLRDASDRKFEAEVKKAEAARKGMQYASDILPKNMEKAFAASNSAFVKSMAGAIKDIDDVMKMDDQVDLMRDLAGQLSKAQMEVYQSRKELDDFLAPFKVQADQLGIKFEDLGLKTSRGFDLSTKKVTYFVDGLGESSEKMTKRADEMADAMARGTRETDRHTRSVERSREKFDALVGVVKHTAKEFLTLVEQEQRFAQATATADAGWIKGMTDMGISQLEYMKLLKDTRVEGLAAASAGVDFKNSLSASQNSLRGLTTNYEEAAKVSGMFHKNMAKIGVSQGNLGDAVLQQTEIYKKNYRALGYTAEEFANLTADLVNDQGMRDVLLTLQEKERKAYVLGIQQRMAEYQTMGYTIERAKELQKTFQALHSMDPKERMKQAAKKRAMMGAMGMGEEASELFNLETRYRTMNAKEKGKADIRMAQIQQRAAGKFGKMSGAGTTLGQSMAMQLMAQKTGFDKVVQTFETASGAGLEFDKKMLGHTSEIDDSMKKILGWMDNWESIQKSSLGSMVTNLISGLGGLLTAGLVSGMVGGLISGMVGSGGVVAAIGTALTAAVGTLALPLAAVAAVLGGAAYIVNSDKEMQKSLGQAIGPKIDTVLSWFNNEDAIQRLDMIDKREAKAEAEAKAKAGGSDTVQENTLALKELRTYLKEINGQNSEQASAISNLAKSMDTTNRMNAL